MKQNPTAPELERVKAMLRQLEEEPQASAPTIVTRLADHPSRRLQSDAAGSDGVPLGAAQFAAATAPVAIDPSPPPAPSAHMRWFAIGAALAAGFAAVFLGAQAYLTRPQHQALQPRPDVPGAITVAHASTGPAKAAPTAPVIAVSPPPRAPAVTDPPTASVPASPPAPPPFMMSYAQVADESRVAMTAVAAPSLPKPAEPAQTATGSPASPPTPMPAPTVAGVAALTSPVSGSTSPAADSRASLPDAQAPDDVMLQKLIAQGQLVLSQGNVASARLLFRRAADAGAADAALHLGDTFDSQRLRLLGVRGVSGDSEQAIRWYEKADELGAPEAKARLLALTGR